MMRHFGSILFPESRTFFFLFISPVQARPVPVPNFPVEFQSSSLFFPASLAAVTGFKKMAATKQESKSITLKGSAELVTEFFGNFLCVWNFEFVWFYSKFILIFSFSFSWQNMGLTSKPSTFYTSLAQTRGKCI